MNLGVAIYAVGLLAPIPTRAQLVSPPAIYPDSAGGYAFRIERGWLSMKDGVRLSITWFRPVPRNSGETFPALLELLPYRKDDSFYRRDYPLLLGIYLLLAIAVSAAILLTDIVYAILDPRIRLR